MSPEETFVIESGIPIPPARSRTSDKYPFGKMEVGRSFKVRPELVDKVRAAACQYAKRHPPYKFSIRFADPFKKSYRCWRIA